METMGQKKEIEPEVLDEIIKAIQQINYGEVVIVVHNSKIVQIKKRDKEAILGEPNEYPKGHKLGNYRDEL